MHAVFVTCDVDRRGWWTDRLTRRIGARGADACHWAERMVAAGAFLFVLLLDSPWEITWAGVFSMAATWACVDVGFCWIADGTWEWSWDGQHVGNLGAASDDDAGFLQAIIPALRAGMPFLHCARVLVIGAASFAIDATPDYRGAGRCAEMNLFACKRLAADIGITTEVCVFSIHFLRSGAMFCSCGTTARLHLDRVLWSLRSLQS